MAARKARKVVTKVAARTAKAVATNEAWSRKPPRYDGLAKDQQAYLNSLLAQDRAPTLDNAASVEATFWTQGNFTIVRLLTRTIDKRLKPEELVGVAKCNPRDDEYSWDRAVKIALARAARGEAQVESA
jgi:hypothetical protein